MFKGEKVFEDEKSIHYLFQKSYAKTNSLVVIFSAFPTKKKQPTYNFIRTLSGIDCNKLFILDDFGSRASYYLCEKKDFAIERSVRSLIDFIIKENNINFVISCGSSKGGYAALYYGIKYGFDHIIAASPQYFLGDYLLEQTNSQDVTDFMSGSSGEEDHQFLNEIMPKMIEETQNKPNIFIHLGKEEPHYENHVKPLLTKLDEKHIPYDLDLGDYSKHSDVGKYFPTILRENIRTLLHYPSLEMIQSAKGKLPIGSQCIFEVKTDSKKNKVAWYVYQDKDRIDMKSYSTNHTLSVTFDQAGNYHVKAFAINHLKHKVSISSEIIEIV
ncbi:Two component regulator three Y domain-containing protein [Rummeliibacillus sp. SL167]|uniref:Two component regulator three Y domain-containing protein n=1 Tax=Rummeliibacillus sp. SL167 TaxID=2579792 RepID=UPI0011B69C72|nr:Two component regulator three Y domain-containing protein [Rummeliibacillus sp. SL167]